MKAWKAETEYGEYSLVVFAETRGKARAIAAGCEEFEDDKFTDIEIRRYPAMDCMYKGARVADWDDPKNTEVPRERTRMALRRAHRQRMRNLPGKRRMPELGR